MIDIDFAAFMRVDRSKFWTDKIPLEKIFVNGLAAISNAFFLKLERKDNYVMAWLPSFQSTNLLLRSRHFSIN